jgi:hypothetical protein
MELGEHTSIYVYEDQRIIRREKWDHKVFIM